MTNILQIIIALAATLIIIFGPFIIAAAIGGAAGMASIIVTMPLLPYLIINLV